VWVVVGGVEAGKVGLTGGDRVPVQVALDHPRAQDGDLLQLGEVEHSPFGVGGVTEAGVAERPPGGGVPFGDPPVHAADEVVLVQNDVY
jgi:hypothetical protein